MNARVRYLVFHCLRQHVMHVEHNTSPRNVDVKQPTNGESGMVAYLLYVVRQALLLTSGVIPAEAAINAQLLTVQLNRQLSEEVWGAGDGHVAGAVHLHLPPHTVREPPSACWSISTSTCVCVCAAV